MPSATRRVLHLLLACVIAVAVVGYFVGIRQGAMIADPPARPAVPPVVDSDALPARSYAEMEGRPFGPNLDWKSTIADLEPPTHDLLISAAEAVNDEVLRQTMEARARLRAFDGAPPVVPHPIDQRSSASCLACHGDGLQVSGIVAPKMSHPYMANCTQCHVEQRASELDPAEFVANDFEGLRSWGDGRRAWAGAPPTVPHPTFMREDCLSCHGSTGPVPIRAPHPWEALAVQEFTCLGCHAGSKEDFRREPWLAHGHTTDIIPPDDMHIPPELPLHDGRITCHTCHIAQADIGPAATFATFSLRVPNDRSQLCHMCHTDYADDIAHGGHPSATVSVRTAAAVGGGNPDAAAAVGGWSPEGSRAIRDQDARDEFAHASHPLGVMEQGIPEALLRAGASGGPDGRLITCRTCHLPHGSAHDDLLVMGTADNALCMTCHESLAPEWWRDDAHRQHHHLMPLSTDAQRRAVRDMGTRAGADESLVCLSCHRMHDGLEDRYLLADTLTDGQMCIRCHPQQRDLIGSSHDFVSLPELTNIRDRTAAETGQCGFCHAAHDAAGPMLWAATKGTFEQPDDLCLSCHAAPHNAATVREQMPPYHELLHPTGPATAGAAARLTTDLPLFDRDARPAADGFVTCASCHATHGDARRLTSLLHRGGTERPVETCHACHQETAHMAMSMHSEPFMRAFAERVDGDLSVTMCAPCHQTHVPDHVASVGMWTGPRAPADQPEDMRNCLGCHGPEGGATPVRLFIHPDVGLVNVQPPGAPGFMPLVDEQGRLGTHGRVTCQTCHLPHGREPGDGFPRIDLDAIEPDRLRALTPMIRPYVAPNLCSSCHGADGLAYFLYYHDPERRARITRQRLLDPGDAE